MANGFFLGGFQQGREQTATRLFNQDVQKQTLEAQTKEAEQKQRNEQIKRLTDQYKEKEEFFLNGLKELKRRGAPEEAIKSYLVIAEKTMRPIAESISAYAGIAEAGMNLGFNTKAQVLDMFTQTADEEFDQETGRIIRRGKSRIAAGEIADPNRPSGPQTVVNVNTAEGFGDTVLGEAGKGIGKGIADRFDSRITRAQEAQQNKFNYDVIEAAIKSGADTGFGQDTILNLKSLAKSLGVSNADDLAGGTLIRSIGDKMALRARNPESGLGLTGNTSNKDLNFLKGVNPGITSDPQGNLAIIEVNRALDNLAIEIAQEQQRLLSEPILDVAGNVIKPAGVPPVDLDSRILDFVNKKEVLTPELRKRLEDLNAISRADKPQTENIKTTPSGIQFKVID